MAKSKVVFNYSKYFQSRWHHGAKISMVDVLYELYQTFESTYDEDRREIEFVLAATRKPILDVFKGFRVVDENRLEVYLDFWHFEANYIASYANLTSLSMPWEILAAMDSLVYPAEGRPLAAYSQSAAARFNVPWLSLVMKRDAALVAREIRKFRHNAFVPKNILMGIDGETDATERFNAAEEWFGQHNHLVVSQGPFMLTRYDSVAQYAELTAFRDPNYPFRPGDWYMGKAEPIKITPTSNTYTWQKGKHFTPEVIVEGRGIIHLTYFLYDPVSNKVIGQVENLSHKSDNDGFLAGLVFNAELIKQFNGNIIQLYLMAASDEIAMVSQKKIDILIVR